MTVGAPTTGAVQFISVDPITGNASISGGYQASAGSTISVASNSINVVQQQTTGTQTTTVNWDGELERITKLNNDLSSTFQEFDPNNTHPYSEFGISKNSTGKVTTAQVTLDPGITAFAGSVGQIFGSAIGRALAPNDPFANIAISTVAGTIGTKFAQVLSASLSGNASQINISSILATGPVDLRAAGAGAVASFLVAELGEQLHFTGFTAQLFNAAAGGFAGSLAQQVVRDGIGVLAGAAWGSALEASGISVGGTLGSILAHQIHPAETQAGAITGQLLGAVGALAAATAIGQGVGLLLDIIVPGIGSLIGTLLGTMIGDAFGHGVPHPTSVDLIEPSGKLYAGHHWAEDDGGDANLSHQLSSAVTEIVNAYLTAVDGMAIDHGKSIMIGYQTGYPAEPYITGWIPNGAAVQHFASAADAVTEVAIDILRNTETIGGNLLLKRAHFHSNYADTGTLSGDLQVAQDYERYLDNRDVINALMAAHPNSAFTAGWAATFARVNDLGLSHYGWSDFLGGLVGYLDSVGKAGLGFDAAAVSVKPLGGGSVAVEIKVPNDTDIPGSLSVFAEQTNEFSDANGTTVQFVFANGISGAFHGPASAAMVSGNWLVIGGAGNNLWFGRDDVYNEYHDNQAAGSNDILIGGAGGDAIFAGNGWDFVDGGAGSDTLFGEDGGDILRGGRGTDFLFGSLGDDTYAFNRGDGVDTVLDQYKYMELDTTGSNGAPGSGGGSMHEVHPNGGSDRLAFGPGIAVSDIAMAFTAEGLVIAVKDPAHPGVPFWQIADRITLQNWADPLDRIETLVFADGTTLDVGASLGTYLVPFGETLSRSSVAENSAVGTVVGTVTASDLDAADVLTYSLRDDVTGGRFAINASSGAITVTGALNFEGTNAWPVTVRVADQSGHFYDRAFTINVTDVNEAPTGIALSGNSIAENSPGGTVIGTAAASDPDAGTVLHYSLLDDAGGRFYISPSSGIIVNVSSQTVNYEGTPAWPIVVRAADQYGQVVDRPFVVNVTNVDEPTTDITLSNGSMAENSALGTVIGTAHGNDPDAGTLYSYSLTGDVTGGRFAINASSGIISVAGPLNFEGTPAWPITVRAADQAGHVFDKPFVINVTNVNEAPADITLSGGSAPENSPGGTIFGTAAASDPDAGTVLTWSLLDDAGGRFFIYAASGIIVNYSSQTIDYEAASSYHVTVRAADQSGLHVDKVLTLTLSNVNEAPADITLSGGSIAEKSPGGTIVGTAQGLDPDAGAVLSYALTDDGGGRFYIYAASGIIVNYSSQTIDYEAASSHHITVRATDQSGLAVEKGFTIAVTDVEEGMHPVAGDFNADGKDDILWTRDNGTVSLWDSGQIANAHWIADPGVVPSSWHVRGTGDFDFDGHDDILWQRDNGAVSVWDGGALAGAHIVADPGVVPASLHIAGVGDFDGNHHADVLWRDDNGAVSVWDNGQIAGAHTVATSGAVAATSRIAGVGDFDGNGRADILWRDDDGSAFVWDNGQISGAHTLAGPGVVANAWHIAGAGDFDGNGHDDILWRNDNGAVSIWDNGQIGSAHIVAAAGAAPASSHIAAIGDYDGNGHDDVLWRDDSGVASIWDNGQIANARTLATIPGDWHIA